MFDYLEDKDANASQSEINEADELSKGWFIKVKTVFILLKISFVSLMLTFAIIARRKREGRYGLVTVMLLINIGVLIGMFFYEIGTEYIPALFLMIYLENLTNFLGFNFLVRNLPTPEVHALRKRTNFFFISMIIAYIIVFCMAFTP